MMESNVYMWVCVWVCAYACASESVLSEHMCRSTCECPPADRHTHVAQWEFWETNENAVSLTDMAKHTTCNHFKDVFLLSVHVKLL